MIKKIVFNKIDENYVAEYELKVIDNTTQNTIRTEIIENKNQGPTLHTKNLTYKPNGIYFTDEYVYYTYFYGLELLIDNVIVNDVNVEYNYLTKCFYLNNVDNVNENSNIVLRYYRNVIEKTIDIPDNSKVVVRPILYKKHYIGNHNVLY